MSRAHTPPKPATLREVIRAFHAAASGGLDARARAALRPFTRWGAHFRSAQEGKLGAYAREHLAALTPLLGSPHHALRHAAAFALGYCEDERAVAPLLGLLVDQKDFFDHDFAYHALGSLGRRAVPGLARAALSGSPEEAYQAVQALGQSRADALPALRRVLATLAPLPKSFFMAYSALADPRGLPDLIAPIRSGGALHARDAVFAAGALLDEAARRSSRRPRGAAALADALAPRLACEEWDDRAPAISCLGQLRDPRYLGALAAIASSSDNEAAIYASEALGQYRTPAARAHLLALLDHPDRARATSAATAVVADTRASPAARARATEVAIEGLATLPHDSPWCSAARLGASSAPFRRALCAAIADAAGRRRKELLRALVSIVHPGFPPSNQRMRQVLATCGTTLEREAKAALRARWRESGRPVPAMLGA
jgi:HEAT repeat protein